MTTCGGFTLGSTALGGSIAQTCRDCMPNLIIEKLQELNNIGLILTQIQDKEL